MNIKQEIMKKYHKMAKFYDLRPIFDFLELLRESGIVNMFGASPFLYAGKQFIEDEVKRKNNNSRWWSDSEDDEENDDEEFDSEKEEIYQKLIDMADDTRNRMIQGAMKSIENQDDENFIRSLQRKIQKDATDIVMIWGNFKGKVIKESYFKKKKPIQNKTINFLFRRVSKQDLDNEFQETKRWVMVRAPRSIPFDSFFERFVNSMFEGLKYKLEDGLVSGEENNIYEDLIDIIKKMYQNKIFELYEQIYN